MSDHDNEAELPEPAKEELRSALKQTFGGALQQTLGAVAGLCFAIVVVRTGVLPFGPERLSTTWLVAMGAVAGLGWLVLHLAVSRPAKKRLQRKLEELEQER